MKALPLIWKIKDEYKKHFLTPGPFHTTMNYIGMLTAHKCNGSGYFKILIEAKLVTSGCLGSVLRGKAYPKALYCLKTVIEAMERLLIERFVEEEKVELTNSNALLDLVQTCSHETLNNALHCPLSLWLKITWPMKTRFVLVISAKTAPLWLSVIDHTCLILMLQYSVKTNNLSLFHQCNGNMTDLFIAYYGPNYSR